MFSIKWGKDRGPKGGDAPFKRKIKENVNDFVLESQTIEGPRQNTQQDDDRESGTMRRN